MTFTGHTLEHFLEDQCGMITPKLIDLLEPHRVFLEEALENFHQSDQYWDAYAEMLWTFLPEPTEDHFNPL